MSMNDHEVVKWAEKIARRHRRRWWPVWAYPSEFEIVRKDYPDGAGFAITLRVRKPPREKTADERAVDRMWSDLQLKLKRRRPW